MNPLVTVAVLGILPLMPLPGSVPAPGPAAATDRIPVVHGRSDPAPATAMWPLEPRPEVVQGFDPPSAWWSAGHRGVDLAGTAGARVRAALPGTVTFAGTIAGRGVVVVGHGAFRTTYEPVRPSVRRGDEVDAGTAIGTLQRGRSHCAPRACLHWGLVRGEDYEDPLTLLGSIRVRLLPWSDEAQARG